MREPNNLEEVTPVRLNTSELRIMALRQQQQIDTQQQLLAAREQRLRFLKAQEACETVAAAEGERLRRLRERVEAQESKLRRLRALRGQVDLQKTYNVTLGNDLDSIRALFSEKEKELTLAVAKVEALTRQLEELRRDRRGTLNLFTGLPSHSQLNSSPAAIELDKLRRELMYRNQLSLQQDARLHLQREALQKRQAELQSVDQRILELQGRLNKKRASNMIQHQQSSPTQMTHSNSISANHVRSVSSNFYPQQRVPRSNIVAVEPFNHIPQKAVALSNNGNKINILNNNPTASNQVMHDMASNNKVQHGRQLSAEVTSSSNINDHNMAAESDENKLARQKKQEYVLKNAGMEYENDGTFSTMHVSQSSGEQINNNKTTYAEREVQNDELIFNSRYSYNQDHIDNNRNICSSNNDTLENLQLSNTNDCDSDKVSDMNGFSSRAQVTATVHSTPLSFLNKSVAVPVTLSPNSPISNEEQHQQLIKSKTMQTNSKGFAYGLLHNIPSGNLVVPPRKPNNGSSPMMAGKQLSSDIKINMVTPQLQNQHISQTTDSGEKLKPALPPKPNKNNTQSSEIDTGFKSITENNSNNHDPMSSGNNIPSKSSTMPSDNLPIKAKPLTIKKSPHSEQPRLKHISSNLNAYKVQHSGAHRMLEMQQSSPFVLPEVTKSSDGSDSQVITDAEKSNQQLEYNSQAQRVVAHKRLTAENLPECSSTGAEESQSQDKKLEEVSRRKRSFISAVISDGKIKLARRVSFDPLALLLDASLEGELELVQKTALQVPNPSAANDEGITALHNAICAGHVEIVKFLVNFGCDVNAQDSDGWTPLHCAASCNNLSMVKFLVESGACLFAATLSDHETPAEKCEEDEEGFDGCSEYLYSIQEKLGILNSGEVYAVFSYDAQQPDELSFSVNDKLTVIRKGDESEREWWWAKDCNGCEGYIPRNLLGFYPRVTPCSDNQIE